MGDKPQPMMIFDHSSAIISVDWGIPLTNQESSSENSPHQPEHEPPEWQCPDDETPG
jgi:hypothetical protein